MRKYLLPLWVFISLHGLLLIGFIFFPALDATLDTLAASTNETGAFAWGWTWVVGSAKLLIFGIFELMILFVVGLTFVRTHRR